MHIGKLLLTSAVIATVFSGYIHAQTPPPLTPDEAYALGLGPEPTPPTVPPEIDLTNVQTGDPFIDIPNNTMGPYAMQQAQVTTQAVLLEAEIGGGIALGAGSVAVDGIIEGSVAGADYLGAPGAGTVSTIFDGVDLLGDLAEANSSTEAQEVFTDFAKDQIIDQTFDQTVDKTVETVNETVLGDDSESSNESNNSDTQVSNDQSSDDNSYTADDSSNDTAMNPDNSGDETTTTTDDGGGDPTMNPDDGGGSGDEGYSADDGSAGGGGGSDDWSDWGSNE